MINLHESYVAKLGFELVILRSALLTVLWSLAGTLHVNRGSLKISLEHHLGAWAQEVLQGKYSNEPILFFFLTFMTSISKSVTNDCL